MLSLSHTTHALTHALYPIHTAGRQSAEETAALALHTANTEASSALVASLGADVPAALRTAAACSVAPTSFGADAPPVFVLSLDRAAQFTFLMGEHLDAYEGDRC